MKYGIFSSVLKLLTDTTHSEAMRHVPITQFDNRRFQIGKPLGTNRTFVRCRTTRLHLFHIAERHSVDALFQIS